MEWNAVPSGKSLTLRSGTLLVRTGKTRSSPGCGAMSPTQLAAVVQWLSAPPPSQVATAGARRVSRRSRRRSVGFIRWLRGADRNDEMYNDHARTAARDAPVYWALAAARAGEGRQHA